MILESHSMIAKFKKYLVTHRFTQLALPHTITNQTQLSKDFDEALLQLQNKLRGFEVEKISESFNNKKYNHK